MYRIVTQVSRYVSHRDFRYRATPSRGGYLSRRRRRRRGTPGSLRCVRRCRTSRASGGPRGCPGSGSAGCC